MLWAPVPKKKCEIMGVYSDYLNRKWDFQTLTAERKVQLARISQFRSGRGVLVYASDFNKNGRDIPLMLDYSDVMPIQDQLSAIDGKEIDIMVKRPGASLKWPRTSFA